MYYVQAPSTSMTPNSDHQVSKLIRQYTEEVAMDTTHDPPKSDPSDFDPQQIPEG